MAKISRLAGSTSNVLTLFIQDSSSSVGAGLTGLTNASGGLACYYKRSSDTAAVAVSLASISTLGTFVSGGFKEVSSANMPGIYEFDPPDAAFTAGAKSVAFLLKGATNMTSVPLEIELTAVDNQSAAFGLVLAKGTNLTGFNDIAATAIVSGGAITTSSGAVSTVTTVGTLTTYTGNTPQSGDSFARIGANGAGLTTLALASQIPASFTSSLFASSGVFSTGALANAPTGGSAPTVGQIRAEMDSNSTKLALLTGAGVNLNPSQTGFTARDVTAVADAALTTSDLLFGGYASGSGRLAASGTTLTAKTASSATTLRTFVLDAAMPATTSRT